MMRLWHLVFITFICGGLLGFSLGLPFGRSERVAEMNAVKKDFMALSKTNDENVDSLRRALIVCKRQDETNNELITALRESTKENSKLVAALRGRVR